MKVLHLMATGHAGGIESLMRDYARYSTHENVFIFVWEGGINADLISASGCVTYFLNDHEIENVKILSEKNLKKGNFRCVNCSTCFSFV